MKKTTIVGGVLVAAGLAAAAGCQLRPQDHPVAAPEASVVASPSPAERARSQQSTVYLIRRERLTRVVRAVEPGPDRLTTALKALVREVDATERDADLSSAVPQGTVVPAWRIQAGELQVELPLTFDVLPMRSQVLAVAQMVLTATDNSDADRVSFVRAGAPVDVPDADGRLLDRPVTRQDYDRLTG